jgi:hypothetical protein
MRRRLKYTAGFFLAAFSPVWAGEQVPVPSGQAVAFHEVIAGETGPLRFRFIAPAIAREGGTVGFDQAAADMEYLCTNYALPLLKGQGTDKVIVSLSDRDIAFGASDPAVTQFFEAYRIEDGACIVEMF